MGDVKVGSGKAQDKPGCARKQEMSPKNNKKCQKDTDANLKGVSLPKLEQFQENNKL